jgi:myo-inositol-1(or 4)-monophosphatase
VATDDPEALRTIASQVAREAAELVVAMRDGGVHDVRTKSSATDVVTSADTAAEELLRDRLARLRPGDAVLGEEGGGGGSEAGRVCWVLDPIDGTVNYLYGVPWYAVSVAATLDGASVAGAVVEPASGRVWSAALGAGADLDGRRLRVSPVERLDRALVGTGFSYRSELRARQGQLAGALLPRARDLRRFGSAALDLCAVAAGWLDGYYEHAIQPWDWAAGALIASEAGAVVRPPSTGSETSGARAVGGSPMMLAAAPGIVEELARTLAELGAGAV